MTAEKTRSALRGFSLLEAIVVVAIIAILAMLAVPNLMAIVPKAQMRGAARGTANLLQQARAMAGNIQKPSRLSLDCRQTTGGTVAAGPCLAQMHTAVFNTDGNFREWVEVPFSRRDLGRTVRVAPGAGAVVIPVPGGGHPSNLFWAVFMPNGQMRASHEPWRLVFSSTNSRVAPWELVVNKDSGRPTLRGLQ
ncbi:MAG: prepilin-type N-terminal cleavage/methylation domain-containing protein [Candidatus Adiutrix sp.]|jgi:prepilin-type N-terminal cleavage/methylation domain-containing protein|nr:prepilin-type N-terminal cleavage/methylation domain-containing protein [Candidatus Adiutrix sp.]